MSQIFPSEEHRTEFLMRLKLLGIAEIQVDFSGSGDSGNIEQAVATTADQQEVDLEGQPPMAWMEKHSKYNPKTQQWDETCTPVELSLANILYMMTEQALEESQLDWYNNDGGQGCFMIDFTESPPEIRLDVGINRMDTDEHSFRFSGTGEMEEEEDDDASASP